MNGVCYPIMQMMPAVVSVTTCDSKDCVNRKAAATYVLKEDENPPPECFNPLTPPTPANASSGKKFILCGFDSLVVLCGVPVWSGASKVGAGRPPLPSTTQLWLASQHNRAPSHHRYILSFMNLLPSRVSKKVHALCYCGINYGPRHTQSCHNHDAHINTACIHLMHKLCLSCKSPAITSELRVWSPSACGL
jgi:hypothetical protein